MMENGWNVNATAIQDYYAAKPTDQMEHRRTSSDILARRLKNRERQRRYRARKRLEADRLRASSTNEATEPLLDVQPQASQSIYVGRVLCKRNWKKDARRAHTCKNSQELSSESAKQGPMAESPLGRNVFSENSCSLTSSEMDKMKACGRNWKAEARSKKI